MQTENILPTRRAIWLGATFGAMALVNLGWASQQLAYAYFSGEGFDVDVPMFLLVAGLFLLATYAASYQLRKVLRQLGHLHGYRRRTIMAEYDPPCSPGVAGALLDGDFDVAEVKAMLISLDQRGFFTRTPFPGGENWTLSHTTTDKLTHSESVLIKSLFANVDTLQLPAMLDRLSGTGSVHDAVLTEAREAGLLVRPTASSLLLSSLLNVARGFGYFVIGLMFSELIFDWDAVSVIHYPRYPVHLWQLLFIVALIAIIVIVAGGAYVRAFVTARGQDLSVDIAGFYYFIKMVFADPARYQAQTDLVKYYPYAVAFRLPAKLPKDTETNWDVLIG
jgi:hypothetical protein